MNQFDLTDHQRAIQVMARRFTAAERITPFAAAWDEEAKRSGLAAGFVPATELVEEALKYAAAIAEMAPLATIANKEMVNAAFETGLAQGIRFERRLFAGLTATQDKIEA